MLQSGDVTISRSSGSATPPRQHLPLSPSTSYSMMPVDQGQPRSESFPSVALSPADIQTKGQGKASKYRSPSLRRYSVDGRGQAKGPSTAQSSKWKGKGGHKGSGLRSASLPVSLSDTVHIFVDNSNIEIGCQFLPSGIRDFSQRLNIINFTKVLSGHRKTGRLVVVGSNPGASIWQKWADAGYTQQTASRNPETNKEEFVDEALCAKAYAFMLGEISNGRPSGILALCTGDGNLSNQKEGTEDANFRNLVRHATSLLGWKVELWSWKASCHSFYIRFATDPAVQRSFKVCFLDEHRSFITEPDQRRIHPAISSTTCCDTGDNVCVYCRSNLSSYSFQPCGHTILCNLCAQIVRPQIGRKPFDLCFLCHSPWTELTDGHAAHSLGRSAEETLERLSASSCEARSDIRAGRARATVVVTRAGAVAACREVPSLCSYCGGRPSTFAFIPCKHKVLCSMCAETVRPQKGRPPYHVCYMCRSPWTDIKAI